MANILKHRFVSAKADGSDATQIQPSNWNDGHAFSGGNAGEVLTRDPSDATFGAKWTPFASVGIWQTYAVTWFSAASPQPAVGNGSLVGAFALVGKAILFQIQLITGTTTTYGASGSAWGFALPPLAIGSITQQNLLYGSAMFFNGSTGETYIGVAISGSFLAGLPSTTAAICFKPGASFQQQLSSLTPFTWVASSRALFQGAYEIA